MLMDHHLATCQRRPPAHPLDLQAQILKAHRVVAVHAAFKLQREYPFQVTTPAGHESIPPLPGRDLKTAVELGDVIFPQKSVRRLERPQLAQPQLLRQAALPGREVALAASATARTPSPPSPPAPGAARSGLAAGPATRCSLVRRSAPATAACAGR